MLGYRSVFLYLVVCLSVGCAAVGESSEEPPELDPALRTQLETWLSENGLPPEEFVLALFKDHDVVFLGEQHRIRNNVTFVQSLIEPLYEAGIYVLATEFVRREDQDLLDSLITGDQYDESLAKRIGFQQSVMWAYREYLDVYRRAWELNRGLDEGQPQFRVLALNDSPDWSHVRTEEDRQSHEVMKRVWRGGGEHFWAETILEAVRSGEKVLVHCGIHHAFSEYRQPVVHKGELVRMNETRVGNFVFKEIGKKCVTIFLHAYWNGPEGYGDQLIHPADGVIDALMLGLSGGPKPVGFLLRDTPFGEIRPRNCVYRHGYDDFRLSDFCDGWIYDRPISEFKGMTVIDGWITEENLEYAQQQMPNPRFRNATLERFREGIVHDAGLPERRAQRLR
jgi:hypothetical protein